MRKVVLGILLATSSATFASQTQTAESTNQALVCTENSAPANSGYTVQIAKNSKSAIVGKKGANNTIKVLSKLVCAPTNAKSPGGDQEVVVLSCSEKSTRDAGYAFVGKKGGIAGLTTGTLSEVTFGGPINLAQMTCLPVQSSSNR